MIYHTNTNENLMGMIKQDEGYRPRPYLDTEGLQTFGIGICIDRTNIPERVAEFWCCYVLDGIEKRLKDNFSVGQTYRKLNEPRQFAIKNMCYQMGVTGVCQFLNMWGALDKEEYSEAAAHALDSVWATQTKARAARIARIIRTGEFIGYK